MAKTALSASFHEPMPTNKCITVSQPRAMSYAQKNCLSYTNRRESTSNQRGERGVADMSARVLRCRSSPPPPRHGAARASPPPFRTTWWTCPVAAVFPSFRPAADDARPGHPYRRGMVDKSARIPGCVPPSHDNVVLMLLGPPMGMVDTSTRIPAASGGRPVAAPAVAPGSPRRPGHCVIRLPLGPPPSHPGTAHVRTQSGRPSGRYCRTSPGTGYRNIF